MPCHLHRVIPLTFLNLYFFRSKTLQVAISAQNSLI
jgi:hypothetical protein